MTRTTVKIPAWIEDEAEAEAADMVGQLMEALPLPCWVWLPGDTEATWVTDGYPERYWGQTATELSRAGVLEVEVEVDESDPEWRDARGLPADPVRTAVAVMAGLCPHALWVEEKEQAARAEQEREWAERALWEDQ